MSLYKKEMQKLIEGDKLFLKRYLDDKTILVSGASGMIGTCLIDLLMSYNEICKKNVKIVALSRNEQYAKERFECYWKDSNFQYFSCDVNQGVPECGDVDYVIHAASNSHPVQYAKNPIGTIMTNVTGTKNLLDYAVSHRTERFCFVSSVEIYGENRGDVEKFCEDYSGYIDCDTLRAGYPESKRLGEALCNAYRQQYGLKFCVPRLSRVYGPTMLPTDSKVTAQFIRKAVAGQDIVLKSKGKQKFSYTFSTDAAMGILYILLLGNAGEAYNVADEDSDIMLLDLAERIAELVGTKVVFKLPDKNERIGYSTETKALMDATKLCALGWKARVHWEQGLACMLEGKGCRG